MTTRRVQVTIAVACAALMAGSPTSFAAARSTQRADTGIGTAPSAPPSFLPKAPTDIFKCERFFVYEGQKLPCDSILRQDGERLRPILQDVPEAVEELNLYQSNRRSVRNAAYVGTAGLVLATLGFFLSQSYRDEARTLDAAGNPVASQDAASKADLIRALMVYGGVGITAGSVVYGISLLRTNELHLGNAVSRYNQARPEHPIELQFTTGIAF